LIFRGVLLTGIQLVEVAHLKMTLSLDSGQWDIGVVNLVRNDFVVGLLGGGIDTACFKQAYAADG